MSGTDQVWNGGGSGPLAGLRVLDLSRILAGPFATMLLGDLGADVIKVEKPGRGDETRHWGPPFAQDGTAAYFLSVNRNKRSVALDLADPSHAEAARRLAETADVMVDNFLPGRLSRYGLDPEDIRRANAGLVSCTITGYGGDTPERDRPGYDFLAQARGGMMAITGPDPQTPTKVGVAVADLACGLFAAVGILAALRQRERTGKGRHVEVPLFDAQVGILANQAMNWLVGRIDPQPMGNRHPNICPYETYDTDDAQIAIGVGTDAQFARLCEAIGHPELAADERFARNQDRVANRRQLAEIIEGALKRAPAHVWLQKLDEAGVPAAPVNTIRQVFEDPQVRGRLLVEDPNGGQVRSPIRIDGQLAQIRTPPPPLGAHTADILDALDL